MIDLDATSNFDGETLPIRKQHRYLRLLYLLNFFHHDEGPLSLLTRRS